MLFFFVNISLYLVFIFIKVNVCIFDFICKDRYIFIFIYSLVLKNIYIKVILIVNKLWGN